MTNYQIMPQLPADDFAALKADVAARGVLVPVEYDDAGNVLDGHHRIKACVELGITEWPKIVRPGLSEEQKRQHARQLNLARRHLNQGQKRTLIAEQLKETPEKSNRQIASGLGVDDKTVGAVRDQLEATAEIPQLDKTTGIDGKARAARPVTTSSRGTKAGARSAAPTVAAPEQPIFSDSDFQAEAEAAARDIEIERDERIALSGANELAEENAKLTKAVELLDRRIAGLLEEKAALQQQVKTWKNRALSAGWRGYQNA